VPKGIIWSLIICTILYIAVSAVLTGMVPYKDINIDAPVVDAFRRAGLTWMQYLVAAGAMTGITSVLLVMMLSQPRVMLALGRDGLVPNVSSAISIRSGARLEVDDPHGHLRRRHGGSLSPLAEMTSIGTLFAFVIVCGAVLVMRRIPTRPVRSVHVCSAGSNPRNRHLPALNVLAACENWYRLVGG
jgi:APA family basic amino acid/polyamine antiporter